MTFKDLINIMIEILKWFIEIINMTLNRCDEFFFPGAKRIIIAGTILLVIIFITKHIIRILKRKKARRI